MGITSGETITGTTHSISKSLPLPRPWGQGATLLAVAACLLFGLLTTSTSHAGSDPTTEVGEAIYLRGVTGSGAPLQASREGSVSIRGAEAACVNCHRRSGFGSREGSIVIRPITGLHLLRTDTPKTGDQYAPYVETMRLDRDATYTEATLARAIREGIDAQGKRLNYLMPHYALNDADMAALIGYLKSLDQRQSPGVTDTVLHFATIVTPDADPAERRGMLDVLERFFADRDSVQFGPSPRLRTSRKQSWANGMYMVNRRWQLHVWELTGPANTWEEQLKRHLAEEPVLAVVSGLGGENWKPVHEFCEQEGVPCLFPNVESPPANADRDFYSLYFSKGVLLEADLIANRILESGDGKAVRTVTQIYRAGESGESAARALAGALKGRGITVKSQILARGAVGQGVAEAVRKTAGVDALVLWLHPSDVAALGQAPAAPAVVFMSGLMGGLENAPLPPGWRSRARLTYPFELPGPRLVPVDYALGWFAFRHVPIVAEQVQADTYLACSLLAQAVKEMVDTFVPDYLVERMQDMLARRLITGYYPHLSLAPGQRFASKGGYIVHFAEPRSRRLVADSGWLVP